MAAAIAVDLGDHMKIANEAPLALFQGGFAQGMHPKEVIVKG